MVFEKPDPITGPVAVGVLLPMALLSTTGIAQPLPGGSLDPTTIPKFVTPLVIPPVMKPVDGELDHYQISVRQFKQQILPAGFPATKVWSYGPAADKPPKVAPVPASESQFNYPAYTVEVRNGGPGAGGDFLANPVAVDWINGLVKKNGKYLKHLFSVDQNLHWANPVADCLSGEARTDCMGNNQDPYEGPVPMITHVHGAHTTPDSDGYPDAWYLPDAKDISCVADPAEADREAGKFVCTGSLANAFGGEPNTDVTPGVANFVYSNDQPSTTLWYHDHTLGMTRLNVYAGPAGFWLIRGADGGEDGLVSGTLPGPAPVLGEDPNFDAAYRATIREIPIVIQDRSFNKNGSLFYPKDRAFFEGLKPNKLKIPFLSDDDTTKPADIAPIWNPEAFFNVMVVNGVSWPFLAVEPERYRLRLLNGSNSRFINLALYEVVDDGVDGEPGTADDTLGAELPFYQIGAEQSLLTKVVKVGTGCKMWLGRGELELDACRADDSGRNTVVHSDEALLIAPAERADVVVDFSGLAPGTRVRMVNTGPDEPFGGFPVEALADADTTLQVMEFTVGEDDPVTVDDSSLAAQLRMTLPETEEWDTLPDGPTRDLVLLEEESAETCVKVRPNGSIVWIEEVLNTDGIEQFQEDCALAGGVPFGPKAALLGTDGRRGGWGQLWSDPIRQNPQLGDTEKWEFWNYSADAHPIHIHLVKFRVMSRRPLEGNPYRGRELTEAGWKDTVITYPGEITTVRMRFDNEGLYVWHCHIVEHEDNEMMVPYCVGDPTKNGCLGL